MYLPLISALQQEVQRSFRVQMEGQELVSAAILLPKFKTGWTDKAEVMEAGPLYLRHHLDQMAEAEVEQGALRQHDRRRGLLLHDEIHQVRGFWGTGGEPGLCVREHGPAQLPPRHKETQHRPSSLNWRLFSSSQQREQELQKKNLENQLLTNPNP